jgi:competence protein ComEC
MPTKILLTVITGFLLGVAVYSFGWVSTAPLWLLVILALTFLLLALCWPKEKRNLFFYLTIFCLAFSFGLFRSGQTDLNDTKFQSFLDQKVSLSGLITVEPKETDQKQQIIFRPAGWVSQVVISADRFPIYQYGDKITVAGKLALPQSFETQTGRAFDYPNYLKEKGICCQIFATQVSKVGEDKSWTTNFQRGLFAIKNSFINQINKYLPEPESSLGVGLIIGGAGNFGDTLQQDFRQVGVSHIVVLSGYNISIVAVTILYLFSRLPLFAGLGLSALGIILFSLAAGGQASVVRAALMALVAIFARTTGRMYQSGLALLFAAFVMIIFNPKILAFDIGFQLSFLATAGLFYLSPIFEKHLGFIPKRFTLRQTAATTFGAQLAVLPWLLYKFGLLSLVAPISNMLILPLVPWTMLLALLVGVAGFIFAPLATLLGWITYLPLVFIIKTIEVLAAVPGSAVVMPEFGVTIVVVAYALIIWLAVKYKEVPK